MADIDVQRKNGGMGWLWGLLAVAALVLVVWWVWPDDEPEVAVEPIPPVTPATTPEPIAEAPFVTIGDILSNPGGYVGQVFPRAEVTVASVPTDRGFWIEDDGQRLFAIIIDQPAEEPKDINPGQVLRIDEGMLRDRTFLPQIPGEPLDQETQNIAEQQPIFLTVDERHINILEGGTPQPGTDPAETIR